jgi:hypothetical protein
MLNDAQVAALCHSIYGGPGGFAHYFPEEQFSICCGIVSNPDENVVIFRGTVPTEFQNWLQDLMAYPCPCSDPKMGPLHAGSFFGMRDMMAKLVPLLNRKVRTTLAGHSLGGQRACEAAGIMLDQYQPNPALLRLVSIAGPACGFEQFLNFIAPITNKVLYRNARQFEGDGVPLLPIRLDPAFAYRNLPRTHVTAPPAGWIKDMDPILWHNSELYVAGILLAQNAPLPSD